MSTRSPNKVLDRLEVAGKLFFGTLIVSLCTLYCWSSQHEETRRARMHHIVITKLKTYTDVTNLSEYDACWAFRDESTGEFVRIYDKTNIIIERRHDK